MKRYWYKECPTCHQGRLFIEYDTSDKRLVLHCEECEFVWKDPELMGRNVPGNVFQALVSDHDFEFPTEVEIDDAGWKKYRVHCTEE